MSHQIASTAFPRYSSECRCSSRPMIYHGSSPRPHTAPDRPPACRNSARTTAGVSTSIYRNQFRHRPRTTEGPFSGSSSSPRVSWRRERVAVVVWTTHLDQARRVLLSRVFRSSDSGCWMVVSAAGGAGTTLTKQPQAADRVARDAQRTILAGGATCAIGCKSMFVLDTRSEAITAHDVLRREAALLAHHSSGKEPRPDGPVQPPH